MIRLLPLWLVSNTNNYENQKRNNKKNLRYH